MKILLDKSDTDILEYTNSEFEMNKENNPDSEPGELLIPVYDSATRMISSKTS